MTCGTCRWWLRRQPNRIGVVYGDCKRFPPVVAPGGCAAPTVKSDDWCGEFAPVALEAA